MEWCWEAELVEWRGPAPFVFLPMTEDDSADLKDEARGLEYWGQVPVEVTIGETTFVTALFPKDGRYLVPVKLAVRRAEGVDLGQPVEASLRLRR